MIRQRLVAGLVTATALVTFAACGSDTKSSNTTKPVTTNASAATSTNPATGVSTPDVSVPDVSVPDVSVPDVSVPDATDPGLDDTVTVPALASAQCAELYKRFVNVAGGADGAAKVGELFDALKKIVPAELKDDVELMKGAVSDPAKAAGNADVKTAVTNLQAWFDSQRCSSGTDTSTG